MTKAPRVGAGDLLITAKRLITLFISKTVVVNIKTIRLDILPRPL